MNPMMRRGVAAALMLAALVPFACGGDNPPPPIEQAGQACSSAGQCYSNLESGALSGPILCIDQVPGGYCTHECTTDADCCAVPGECRTAYPQVCSPFESMGKMYCFLSCEDRDLAKVGLTDANAYCGTYAYAGLNCRSSGGGASNRKVCTP